MKIQILGTGCPKCKTLGEITEEVAKEMNLDYEFEKVTDIVKIMEFGVMTTPALVINGKVIHAGSIPSRGILREMLTQEA